MDPLNEGEKKEIPPQEPIKSLRTYQGDVEEAVSKGNYSATSIFTAEQNKSHKLVDLTQPTDERAKKTFYILVGSILLILGTITIVAVYYTKSNEQIVIEQKTKALIGYSKEKTINIASSTREKLLSDLAVEKQTFNLPLNSILYVNTIDEAGNTAQIEKLLPILTPRMPSSLSRSLDNKYMIGLYSFDTDEHFIIFTTNDFSSSFSGMLKWEENIVSDIGKLFPQVSDLGTTTPVFVDEALRNRDLRILENKNGKTVLLYSFIDKNTILITANEDIFNAIVSKFLIGNQTR